VVSYFTKRKQKNTVKKKVWTEQPSLKNDFIEGLKKGSKLFPLPSAFALES